MPEQSNSSAPTSAGGYIDAHVHLWTPDRVRYPLIAGFSDHEVNPPSFTPDDLFAFSKPLGVDRSALVQMNFYGFDNSYMLDCIRHYPGVFAGIAQVDEQGANPAAEMIRLKKLGVRGVRILPPHRAAPGWLNGPGMRAMWNTAAEERLAICPLIDAEDLPAVDRMCREHTETIVVIDHCARIGGDGHFHEADIEMLCRLARHPRTHVKLSAFYFLGAKQPPYSDLLPLIRRLLDAYGPERLMWATDSPFQVQLPHSYQASLELIRDGLDFASSTDRHWILARTAANLFFT